MTDLITQSKLLMDNEINIEAGNLLKISDGYHTFGELYKHRHSLFCLFMLHYDGWKFKSMKHHDDTPMYEGYFIAGANLCIRRDGR